MSNMFNWLLEKEASDEEAEEEEGEEEEEEEEEEVVEQEDEQTVFFNREITECFQLFDKNNSGNMETKYLGRALDCLGILLSPFELKEAEEELDAKGIISIDKFRPFAFEKLTQADPVEALKISFQAFDPDREGILSTERFKKWMTTLGDPLTEKEAKELARMGDPAGKGIMTYDDLVMILLKG